MPAEPSSAARARGRVAVVVRDQYEPAARTAARGGARRRRVCVARGARAPAATARRIRCRGLCRRSPPRSRPPCSSTSPFESARPMPSPPSSRSSGELDLHEHLKNRLQRLARLGPMPLSTTRTLHVVAGALGAQRVCGRPTLVYFAAFVSRFADHLCDPQRIGVEPQRFARQRRVVNAWLRASISGRAISIAASIHRLATRRACGGLRACRA